MYDDNEYTFSLDEDVIDNSSVENYIYQEVVNRKEKERRSKIKADYIKTHGKNSNDDEVRKTPSNRDSYKKSHDMHEKEIINGERDITAKDTMGYTRLYGKDGKRDATGWGDSQYKSSPARKEGIFKRRYQFDKLDGDWRINNIKNLSKKNKLDREEKEIAKKVPHKDKIDKIANKIRGSYAASKAKQFKALSDNKKVPKIVRDYVNSPESDINRWAAYHYNNALTGGALDKDVNRSSPAVHIAYAADKALSKGTKKAKDVAKKFVANKLKHNRSAKSENTDLLDFTDDWDI